MATPDFSVSGRSSRSACWTTRESRKGIARASSFASQEREERLQRVLEGVAALLDALERAARHDEQALAVQELRDGVEQHRPQLREIVPGRLVHEILCEDLRALVLRQVELESLDMLSDVDLGPIEIEVRQVEVVTDANELRLDLGVATQGLLEVASQQG